MNIMGIDFGLKHTGIAISESNIAYPLTTISTQDAPRQISILTAQYQINKIIIGDADLKLKPYLDAFISILPDSCEVILYDETLSSKDAIQALMHTSSAKRKKLKHQVSAAIILQHYIDSSSAIKG